MSAERRKFTREPPEARREALLTAALELMAEGGVGAATSRAIAARAGVTAGLIRHHFATKDELTHAAFGALMTRMTEENRAVLALAPQDPVARLAVFVAAALTTPVVDARRFGLWATFMAGVAHDAGLRDVHRTSYLAYRDNLETLIAEVPGCREHARNLAIAANGVIDGLWLEGCALPEQFASGDLARIGLGAVGAMVGQDLEAAKAKAEKQ